MISGSGALGGLLVGTLIYASLGPRGFAVLALFVIGGSLLTRLGYASKARTGTAQEHGGRRSARNALANCAVATFCAILAAVTGSEPFIAAFVASLGAAFADTAESEIGQLFGRTATPYLNPPESPTGHRRGHLFARHPGRCGGRRAHRSTRIHPGDAGDTGSPPPRIDRGVPGHGRGQPDRGPLTPRR